MVAIMNGKNDVLESWIMVEHLSEGDINLKDKSIITLSNLEDENYYALFMCEIQKKKIKKYQKGGIVIYFNIFPFTEIIYFLSDRFHLSVEKSEIEVGDKFSFALYFDKKLKVNSDMTFLTESYYIKEYKKIPREAEFLSFEDDIKKKYEEIFDCPADMDYPTHFNNAIKSILKENNIEISNCRMKVVENLETDATNLHSFFVADLEKAKCVKNDILDDYILGRKKQRVDLDSRVQSSKFNREIFNRILQPINYPLSRFPSKAEYSLSFMQQVAVNLAIGYDNEQFRSVNGPPGTGKTTLLKDIFAELVVEQAYEIVGLAEKCIKGSEKTRYWDKASIGIVPEKIAARGIVVTSSNNGAVQNIVDELPLLTGIDKESARELIEIDYFRNIANSNVSSEWCEDENGNKYEKLISSKKWEKDKFWGLFSLEGGKKDNMDYIITVLKHVANYLEEEYESDEEVYTSFLEKYDQLRVYRNKKQKVAEEVNKLSKLSEEIENLYKTYESETADKKKKLEEYKSGTNKAVNGLRREMKNLDVLVQEQREKLLLLQDDEKSINQCIEALKLQKPGLFSTRKRKKEYKEKCKEYSDQIQKTIQSECLCKRCISEYDKKVRILQDEIIKNEKKNKQNQDVFDKWNQKVDGEIKHKEKQVELIRKSIDGIEINNMDFAVDYRTLQLSNPWFDIEYRQLQSQLFISALRVRKQFLYDNVKNIKAAYLIWSKQKEHLNRKLVIAEAWNWINMVIPVVSSTFASVSRMYSNLDEKTIGYLFVDEAGQALPQASVGAIFRSRNVMVVGDPSQIIPVLTLDPSILGILGEHFGVSEKYLSENASTQTLVDDISKYGFYKDRNKEEWIGIPLWVHRRCKRPMFDIANKISYDGNMVQAEKLNGFSEWFDVCGSAIDKYVVEQGVFLREKIQEMSLHNPDILDKKKKDIIYVITPFKNVAYHLSQELRSIGFTRYDEKGKAINVGTVHTFQGKEAPIVFLVLGADEKSKGAANWAMGTQNPNIMNVAATRAKDEFYIIGNKNLYLGLKSNVINETYEIMRKYTQGL